MADLTPEERAGLRQDGRHCSRHGQGCNVRCSEPMVSVYTVDPAVLAALLQRHDEAVELLRVPAAEMDTAYFAACDAFLAALDREDRK